MKYTIQILLKIGKKAHIEDLYKNGTIYMNPLKRFHEIEDNYLRGDKYEGLHEIINSSSGIIKINNIDYEYSDLHFTSSNKIKCGNLYSMFCVSSKNFPSLTDFKIDNRILEFGSHCLIILDPKYFLDTIQQKLTEYNYRFQLGLVRYYNKYTTTKKLSPFEKPLEYEYQKEFRIYIENESNTPHIIKIGSLKNYSTIIKSEDLLNLQLEYKN